MTGAPAALGSAAMAVAVIGAFLTVGLTATGQRSVRGVTADHGAGRRARPSTIDFTESSSTWPAPSAALALLAAIAVWLGVGHAVLASPFAVGGVVFGRQALAAEAVRRRHRRAEADAPLAGDLMAACLAVGADGGRAASVVGAAVGGPLGRALVEVGASVALGADPIHAWRQAMTTVPALGPLARAVARSATTGAPLASVVASLSDDVSQAQQASARAAARRVGVLLAAPLGLCFLPAFVLLGLIPVIAAVATSLLAPP